MVWILRVHLRFTRVYDTLHAQQVIFSLYPLAFSNQKEVIEGWAQNHHEICLAVCLFAPVCGNARCSYYLLARRNQKIFRHNKTPMS